MKMMRLAVLLLPAALLSACGTHPYLPTEYPLRDGLIPSIDVAGTPTVTNNQPSTDPMTVSSYAGTSFAATPHDITEMMVKQATKELSKAAKPRAGGAKTIALKVNKLESDYIAFFYKSELDFDATLGDGQTVHKLVKHSSGVLIQDLNGCIAEAVLNLLNDAQVRSYLAK